MHPSLVSLLTSIHSCSTSSHELSTRIWPRGLVDVAVGLEIAHNCSTALLLPSGVCMQGITQGCKVVVAWQRGLALDLAHWQRQMDPGGTAVYLTADVRAHRHNHQLASSLGVKALPHLQVNFCHLSLSIHVLLTQLIHPSLVASCQPGKCCLVSVVETNGNCNPFATIGRLEASGKSLRAEDFSRTLSSCVYIDIVLSYYSRLLPAVEFRLPD